MKTLYSVAIGPVIASALTVAVATQSKHLIRATESMGVQPKSFLVKGTKTATLNNRKFRFEIGGELPDKFLWKEELGVQGVLLRGFNGRDLITDSPPSFSTGQQKPGLSFDDQIGVAQLNFIVVTMGLAPSSYASVPLTFNDTVTAPPTVSIQSAGRFNGTLELDLSTFLPKRLRYVVEAGMEGGGRLAREWVYADYREVQGRKAPFQWDWFAGSERTQPLKKAARYVVEELSFDGPFPKDYFRPSPK